MAENWAAIAAEVEAAIASIGDVSQPQGHPATIRRVVPGMPDPSTPYIPAAGTITYTTVRVMVSNKELRDVNGTLIGMTKRTVTISGAAGIAPTDDDRIALGIEAEAASESTIWETIVAVRPLSPAGVAVLYELDLSP